VNQVPITLSFEDLWRANLSFLLKKHFVRVPMLFLTFSFATFFWALLLFKSLAIAIPIFFLGLLVFYGGMRLTTVSRLKKSVSPDSMEFSITLEEGDLRVKWNLSEKIYRKKDINSVSQFLGIWTLFTKSGETLTIPKRQLSEEQLSSIRKFAL